MHQLVNSVKVAAVSIYLVGVGLWLLGTRQVRVPGVGRLLGSSFRKPYKGPLANITPEAGNCWTAPLPDYLPSDQESASSLVLFEDDHPLGPGHQSHDNIRKKGAGHYSHWGAQLYFSTSDNTDPRSNGRRYHVEEVRT